jgi:radical SAM superfamily enzyme YgiQ (UPF0313 family)
MRIAFYIPPFFRMMGSHNNKIGPSTMSVANILNSLGHKTLIYNGDSLGRDEEYADWYSIAKNYHHYRDHVAHLSEGAFEIVPGVVDALHQLGQFNPDYFVMCCGDPAIPTVDIGGIEVAYHLLPIFRKYLPTAKILGYGYAFDHNPSLAKKVDFVIPAYGESTIYQLGPFVDHITLRDLSRVHLDAVPHAIPKVYPEVEITSFDYVMSSRGCAWGRCVFCPHSVGSPLGAKCSPSWFADEVSFRHSKGIRYQYFADMDFLSHSVEWLKSWSSLVTMGHQDLGGLSFSLETRASNVTRDKLHLLKRVGLTTVKIGLEGATENLLHLYKKGVSISQVRNSISLIKEFDLKLVLYLLLGHPLAVPDDYKASLEIARELQADYYVINIACPYRGTELYRLVKDDLEKAGLIKDGIERGFTHLSDDLRKFWRIPEDLFEEYLKLSAGTTKEDDGVGQKRKYVRRILT